MRFLLALMFLANSVAAEGIIAARYLNPTDRYAHGVLGDAIEFQTLEATLSDQSKVRVTWKKTIVFEDLEPRLHDMDGDGAPELITIQSHEDKGAQVAVYQLSQGGLKPYAATPFIGRPYRWLAIVGMADFDGDGTQDIAYVDRPHLAKTLRVWQFSKQDNPKLREIANLAGVTNHRIGDAFITSGVRACGSMSRPEMVMVDANWSTIMGVTLSNDVLNAREIAPFTGSKSMDDALAC